MNFRDVGYPDSATLLRVGDLVRSGRMYSDFHRPPYQLTVYAPLTYVLHAIPYALGEQVGLSHQGAVRSGVLASFVLCLTLLFLIGRGMSSSPLGDGSPFSSPHQSSGWGTGRHRSAVSTGQSRSVSPRFSSS
jgi:hypothetical protein